MVNWLTDQNTHRADSPAPWNLILRLVGEGGMRRHPLGVEPADLVKGLPHLAGLVDVDVACLLRIRLAKLFGLQQALEPALEDAALGRQVRRAVDADAAGQVDLLPVEEVHERIAAQVHVLTAPLNPHAAGLLSIKRRQGRRVVRNRLVILVGTGRRLSSGLEAVALDLLDCGLWHSLGSLRRKDDGRRRLVLDDGSRGDEVGPCHG